MIEDAVEQEGQRNRSLFDSLVNGSAAELGFAHLLADLVSRSSTPWTLEPSSAPHQAWTSVNAPNVVKPTQGWKLHVSGTVLDAHEILRRCLGVLLTDTACFKVVGSLAMLEHLNEGRGGATQVGKFITVYPNDDSHTVRIASALDAATRDTGLHGPSVPSDRPVRPGSLVSYRFGSFGTDLVQTPIGETLPALRTPDGRWVPDRRNVRFDPPDWAADPFAAADVTPGTWSPEGATRLICGEYLPLATLYSSPRGEVLLATDLARGRVCVLKSAHAYAALGPDGWDAHARLRHEAEVLSQLAPLAPVPGPLALVQDNSTLYLVLEDMGGITLETHIRDSTSAGRPPDPAQALALGRQLAHILTLVHEAGFVFGDLKSVNVLRRADGRLCLVDLEGAQRLGFSGLVARSGTRGYCSPGRHPHQSPTVANDVYGLGALLYFLATGAEPSLAPRPQDLLSRPTQLLNPRVSSPFSRVIARCLAPTGSDDRLQSPAEVSAALEDVREPAIDSTPFGLAVKPAWARYDQDRFGAMAAELGATLCASAVPGPDGSLAWMSIHSTGVGIRTRDVNAGNAGTVLALAELVSALGDPGHREVLTRGTAWLRAIARPKGELTGLYVGEGGVASALLRAGQVLGDCDLIEEASERGQWMAKQAFVGPDLMNGAAGRLRAQLLLWDELGDAVHLSDAVAAGDWLLTLAEPASPGLRWRIPGGFGGLSHKAPLGYAHGAAGIGDALLDLADATGDERFLAAAHGAATWLDHNAQPSATDHGLDWPDVEGQDVSAPFWCRGSAGIGRFLLRAAASGLPAIAHSAMAAAHSSARNSRWASATQCHGLAGNIELLLDAYQATAEPSFLSEAAQLANVLEGSSAKLDSSLCWPSENGSVYSPDYMVGYAGVLVCLLRLSDLERPHQLSRAGFRYQGVANGPAPRAAGPSASSRARG